MVCVVVDDDRAGEFAENLKAAVDAEEPGQTARDDGGFDAQLASSTNRRERVPHIVLAGNEEPERTDARHIEHRPALVELKIRGVQIRLGGKPIPNDTVPDLLRQFG